MPVNLSEMTRIMTSPEAEEAWRRERDRWDALTAAQQDAECAIIDARMERARKRIAFLDYCVANKIDPNLGKPRNS